MIKKIWSIITPIISAIIGLAAANQINIFELLPFVPKEYSYEVCITTYFALADVILGFLREYSVDKIQNSFFSAIEVIINRVGVETNVDTNAVLTFDEYDLAEAVIIVKIKGRKKHFKNVELVIKKPAFAEIQDGYSKRQEVHIDSDNYYIRLENIFGHSDKLECKQVFNIAMIQNPVDGDSVVLLIPELSQKKLNIRFQHNNAELKAVKR